MCGNDWDLPCCKIMKRRDCTKRVGIDMSQSKRVGIPPFPAVVLPVQAPVVVGNRSIPRFRSRGFGHKANVPLTCAGELGKG